MELSGLFPGAMKLAGEGEYPNALLESGMLKSFISLFMMTPVSGTTNREPNKRLMVVVSEIAIPEASAVTTCDVPPSSSDSSSDGS